MHGAAGGAPKGNRNALKHGARASQKNFALPSTTARPLNATQREVALCPTKRSVLAVATSCANAARQAEIEQTAADRGAQSRLNALQVFAGTNTLYPLATAHKIKTAFGSDLLFSSELAARQGVMLTHLKRWYENVDILRMATSVNGELLAVSGPRNPYPGKLGVVEKGALADLVVVSGDPVADIALFEKPDTSLAMIMKGGRIYKNALN